MTVKLYLYLNIFLLVIFFSCEKTVTSFKPENPNLQVISAIQSYDSVAECFVTTTNSVNNININYISNAHIYLSNASHTVIDTLVYTSSGKYKGKIKLNKLNQDYFLQSQVSNYPVAGCSFQIPDSIKFDIVPNPFDTIPPWTDFPPIVYRVINFDIKDGPEENFYLVECFFVDSGEVGNYYPYQYSSIQLQTDNVIAIKQGLNGAILGNYIYFDDKSFNNTSFLFDVKLFAIPPKRHSGDHEAMYLFVLRTLSKSYYQFLKSNANHQLGKDYADLGINYIYSLYPLDEVSSNISGGVGIYGCYNTSVKKVILTY